MIKAKVADTQMSIRQGVSPKTGKPYKIQSQDVIVELNGEVRRVPINIPEGGHPYPVGNYTIDPMQMIAVGNYGFEFKRFHDIQLVPAPLSAVQRAAQ